MGLHCFKKHVIPTNFYGDGKEEETNFSMVKKYGRHETSISLFKRAFYYFIVKYFFVKDYPFKSNCQIEFFIIVCLMKDCFPLSHWFLRSNYFDKKKLKDLSLKQISVNYLISTHQRWPLIRKISSNWTHLMPLIITFDALKK